MSEGWCWALLGGCRLAEMLTGPWGGGRTKGWPPCGMVLYTGHSAAAQRGRRPQGFLALADCCWTLILQLAHGVWLAGSGQSEESPCPPQPPGAEPLFGVLRRAPDWVGCLLFAGFQCLDAVDDVPHPGVGLESGVAWADPVLSWQQGPQRRPARSSRALLCCHSVWNRGAPSNVLRFTLSAGSFGMGAREP